MESKNKQKTTAELMAIEARLGSYTGKGEMVSSTDLALELAKTADSQFELTTGIKKLDELTTGVEAGELVVVTGPTGEGKTTLLMSITDSMAKRGINTAWFTLEVTPRQFLKKITQGNGTLPVFYLPNENVESHIDWIEERIIESQVKYNTQVIFIDHIHQIFSLVKMNNISLEIGDLVGKIKDIAKRRNLVIYLVAHSKDNSLRPNAEPRKEDIRDSGMISRVADTILGVWRIPNTDDGTEGVRDEINETDNKAKVRVFKNRRTGILGSFVMEHNNHKLTDLNDF